MQELKDKSVIPLLAFLSYVLMIIMNVLSEALPINGKSTGEISDHYANLFAPAGITFSIWGLIYLLLLVYSVFQLVVFQKEKAGKRRFYKQVGFWFILSSIANTLWILAWHYEIIWLSLLLIAALLFFLIKINLILREKKLTSVENITVRLPFTVYFGWLTVASIANATVFLVAVRWNRFSLSEVFWTDVILLVGAAIGFTCILFYKSFAYGFVLLWAFLGILIRHLSPGMFAGRYPSVIVFVSIAMAVIILAQLILLYLTAKKRGKISDSMV